MKTLSPDENLIDMGMEPDAVVCANKNHRRVRQRRVGVWSHILDEIS
jgi:hypothetical protein